jgi:hypothetical protein
MLSDEEKQRIVDRIEFEREIREKIEKTKSPARKSLWETLNSGLVILLMGSLLSAIVVPIFQRYQHDLEWKRQTKAENMKYRLDKMREGLQEMELAATYTSEVHEIANTAGTFDRMSQSDFRKLYDRLTGVQSNRFKQNAAVHGFLLHFTDQPSATKAVMGYIAVSTAYIDTVRSYLQVKYEASIHPEDSQLRTRLHNQEQIIADIQPLNEKYDECTKELNRQLEEREALYENFRF